MLHAGLRGRNSRHNACRAEPFYAASIVAAGALRGAGDTRIPSLLNLVSMWGVLFLIRLKRGKWLWKNLI